MTDEPAGQQQKMHPLYTKLSEGENGRTENGCSENGFNHGFRLSRRSYAAHRPSGAFGVPSLCTTGIPAYISARSSGVMNLQILDKAKATNFARQQWNLTGNTDTSDKSIVQPNG